MQLDARPMQPIHPSVASAGISSAQYLQNGHIMSRGASAVSGGSGHRYTQSTASPGSSQQQLQARPQTGASHLNRSQLTPNYGYPYGEEAMGASSTATLVANQAASSHGHRRYPSASPSVTSLVTSTNSSATATGVSTGVPAITDLAFAHHTTTGDVPPPLAGASLTVLHDPAGSATDSSTAASSETGGPNRRVYLFGGRLVSTRKMTNELYSLDLDSFVWRHHREEEDTAAGIGMSALAPATLTVAAGNIGAPPTSTNSNASTIRATTVPKDAPPPIDNTGKGYPPDARYFHSANLYSRTSLIIFGGMGQRRARDGQDASVVLNDVHVLELLPPPAMVNAKRPTTGASDQSGSTSSDRSQPGAASGKSREGTRSPSSPSSGTNTPGGHLHLPRVRWRKPSILGMPPAPRYAHLTAICGHQLLVVGGQDLQNNYLEDAHLLDLRTFTWLRRVDFPRHCGVYRSVLEVSNQRAYVYSNYNFTEVKRELQVLDPSTMTLQDRSSSMRGDVLPPGLRFPVGSRAGDTLVVSGTYLTNTTQSFSIWRLDIPTLTWSRLSTARQLDKGSWNRAVLDVNGDRYLIFGNRNRQLLADYEHRRVNFEHVVEMRLDAYGVYEAPQSMISAGGRDLGLALWANPRLADFEIRARAPADAPPVRVNSTMLRRRWSFLHKRLTNQERNPALPRARAVTLHAGFEAVRGFVEYLHTLDIDPDPIAINVLCGMLVLGAEYDVPGLSRVAAARLQLEITHGGPVIAWRVLVAARRAGHVGLRVRALRMLAGRDGVDWLEASPEFWSDAMVLAEADASGGAWDSDDVREARDEVLAYVGSVLQRRASSDGTNSRIVAAAASAASSAGNVPAAPGHGQSMSVSYPRHVIGVGQQVVRQPQIPSPENLTGGSLPSNLRTNGAYPTYAGRP